jgi:histidinol dehydrogenase
LLKIFDYPSSAAEKALACIASRGLAFTKKEHAAVRRILDEVKTRGDEALVDFTRRFDAPDYSLKNMRVEACEFAAAKSSADRAFLRALSRAASQIEAFHRRQLRSGFVSLDRPGTMLGQLVRPVERAGVYVPGGQGGRTPLVSSVLMGPSRRKWPGSRKSSW